MTAPDPLETAIEAATAARVSHRLTALRGREEEHGPMLPARWSCSCGTGGDGSVAGADRHLDEAAVRAAAPILTAQAEAQWHTWDGLLAWLDHRYPTDVFPVGDDNPARDDGPRILSLVRRLAEVERERDELHTMYEAEVERERDELHTMYEAEVERLNRLIDDVSKHHLLCVRERDSLARRLGVRFEEAEQLRARLATAEQDALQRAADDIEATNLTWRTDGPAIAAYLRKVAKAVNPIWWCVSYWIRPYDMCLDTRRWRWQRSGCWRMSRAGRRWQQTIQRWVEQLQCPHHWHAADAMILWRCCRCGKDADGWPRDRGECSMGDPDG